MNVDDVPPYEMGSDHDIAHEELERFLQDLRTAFPAQMPVHAEGHLAAMFETAHLLAENGDPVARPVSNADAPAAQVSRLPKRRRDTTVSEKKYRPIRARALRALAPLVAAFTILGVMASANALPRTVQHAASTAAGWVGLDVPDTAPDATEDQTSEDDQGDLTKDESTAPEDNQGDEDDQGEAATEGDQGEDSQDDSTTASEGDQGDDDQGEDEQGSTSTSSDDNQGDDDDQGDSTGSAGTGNEDEQGDSSGSGSQDDQGDSSDSSGSGSGSGDNQD